MTLTDIYEKNSNGGSKEHHPSAKSVDNQSKRNAPNQTPNLKQGVNKRLCSFRFVSNGVQDQRKVIRDEAVAAPLREKSNGKDDKEAVSVARCLEKSEVGSCLGRLRLKSERFSDLSNFQSYDGVLGVASGVVLCDEGMCALDAIFRNKPTRRFFNAPAQEQLDHA